MRKRHVLGLLVLIAIGVLFISTFFARPRPMPSMEVDSRSMKVVNAENVVIADKMVERDELAGQVAPEPAEATPLARSNAERESASRRVRPKGKKKPAKYDTIEVIAADPGEGKSTKESALRGAEEKPQVMLLGGAERLDSISDSPRVRAREMAKNERRAGKRRLSPAAEMAKPRKDVAALRQIRAPAPTPPVVVAEPDVFDGFENQVRETETKVTATMIETSADPMSTFSVDVDTAGYTLARARLRAGYRPKPEDVRIEEFLNYFHYDYPDPMEGEFSVHLEAAPDPLATGRSKKHLVRIGVKGKSVPAEARPPAHLTFLVDVSGSMFGPDRLGLVIESLDLVTRNLRPDDTIALVTYAQGAHVRLWPAGAAERDIVAATIASLEPGGSSALDDGLRLAYEVASTHFYAGQINRVVLLGDGKANVGETRPDALLASVRAGVEDGVMLSTIGFGSKSFNDQMMERLADRGNGSYFFVDSYREAQKVFGDQLCGTLFAIAHDVKIQVEFNPESVLRHRLLGYENRRLEHKQFRDDQVDAGEVGAGHSVTALYEVELAPDPGTTLASVRIRYKKPGESAASETSYQLFTEELRQDVRAASSDFKFAAAVAMFAEIARGDTPGGEARISLVREIASEGVTDSEHQPDRAEFLALLDEAAPYYAN